LSYHQAIYAGPCLKSASAERKQELKKETGWNIWCTADHSRQGRVPERYPANVKF